MQTVIFMIEKLLRGGLIAVVVVPVDLLADLVEAVDQVEDVDLGKVAVWAEVPG